MTRIEELTAIVSRNGYSGLTTAERKELNDLRAGAKPEPEVEIENQLNASLGIAAKEIAEEDGFNASHFEA